LWGGNGACARPDRASVKPRSNPGQTGRPRRYEQGRQDEALALLRQSLALWFKPEGSDEEEDDDDDGDGEEEEEGEEEEGAGGGGKGAAGGEVEMADAAAAKGGKRGGVRGGGGGGGDGPLLKPRTMSEDPGEDAGGEGKPKGWRGVFGGAS
jgi:hypothetical protein